ncbi:MAG: hypothetical protein NUV97_02325 [archaeon]|nr:hypothetical protein [archaeon]MCR4323783.1 hypothetical protein [Nanoarchaeota archaeon]
MGDCQESKRPSWREFVSSSILEMKLDSGKVLFDVEKGCWDVSPEVLDFYCRNLYRLIDAKFKENYESKRYSLVSWAIYGKGLSSKKNLAASVGGGFPLLSPLTPLPVEWAIWDLMKGHEELVEPVYFRLFIKGYGDKTGDPDYTPFVDVPLEARNSLEKLVLV